MSSKTNCVWVNSVVLVLCLVVILQPSFAENIVFPESSGVVDVTKAPYSIDNSGKSDVTTALQQVITMNSGWRTIYLPNGTYLVSNTLKYPEAATSAGPILQGQSTQGTVIKLKEGVFPASENKAVIWTGSGVAQKFRKGLHNMTVLVDRNNPGAIGVQFYGNNESLMSDVDIISADRQGKIGLELAFGGEQGPCGVRDIQVTGFDIGVELGGLNSVTAYNVTVEEQNSFGCVGKEGAVFLENLKSNNSVPALENRAQVYLTLLNAECNGGNNGTPAIINHGILYARDVSSEGYQKALENREGPTQSPGGNTVDEFCSHEVTALWDKKDTSLNLPVKQIPEVPWEQNMDNWGVVEPMMCGLGETPEKDGCYNNKNEALQDAIDEKTTVLLSNQTFTLRDTLFIRGKCQRLIGVNGASISGDVPIVIVDGDAAVVKIHRIFTNRIIQRSSRTVVIEQLGPDTIIGEGSGDIFIFDICGLVRCSGENQHIWARQMNAEAEEGHDVTIDSGKLWIFGWKSEHHGTKLFASGGELEILGMMMYAPCGDHSYPLMIVENTQFSLAGFRQINYCGGNGWYSNLIRETRNGETRNLTTGQNYNSHSIPLYTGYGYTVDAGGQSAAMNRGNSHSVPTAVHPVIMSMKQDRLPSNQTDWLRYTVFDARGAIVGMITRTESHLPSIPSNLLEGPDAVRFIQMSRETPE